MLPKIFFIFKHVVCILFLSNLAWSERTRYTCPNGNVQYVPCWPSNTKKRPPPSSSKQTSSILSTATRVSNTSFTKLASNEGHWQGYVLGRGQVTLSLAIYSNSKLVETRQIGQVTLDKPTIPVKFTFLSSLPKFSKWDWEVLVEQKARNLAR